MIPMRNVVSDMDAIRAIIEIIQEQKALQKFHCSTNASVETVRDSMVYAYDEIIKVVKPFMDDEVCRAIVAAGD
jgi:hypothetical protein